MGQGNPDLRVARPRLTKVPGPRVQMGGGHVGVCVLTGLRGTWVSVCASTNSV